MYRRVGEVDLCARFPWREVLGQWCPASSGKSGKVRVRHVLVSGMRKALLITAMSPKGELEAACFHLYFRSAIRCLPSCLPYAIGFPSKGEVLYPLDLVKAGTRSVGADPSPGAHIGSCYCACR